MLGMTHVPVGVDSANLASEEFVTPAGIALDEKFIKGPIISGTRGSTSPCVNGMIGASTTGVEWDNASKGVAREIVAL